MTSTGGFVSLVGAGPGDPDLLTVKAVRRLGEADAVLHDALVDARVLALAPRARVYAVGARVGAPHDQRAINRLMVDLASGGARVVRLKGGDPMVLARGGEEAWALAEAGVPFEIVPGVTAATAAPALAGIPLTHRGIASGFVVISGHDEQRWAPLLAATAPGAMTLVVLMGLGARTAIVAALVRAGWRRSTPAAVILRASTPEQRVWRGALQELPAVRIDAKRDGPGVIVIGDVVAVAQKGGVEQPLSAAAE